MEFAADQGARAGGEVPAAIWLVISSRRPRATAVHVHAGVVLCRGRAGSSVFQKEAHKRCQKGESLEIGDYSSPLREIATSRRRTAMHTAAVLSVARTGGRWDPEAARPCTEMQKPMTEVALTSRARIST